jgi:hypothetical protein
MQGSRNADALAAGLRRTCVKLVALSAVAG